MIRSGLISSIATVVAISWRKLSLRALKSATVTLLLVVHQHFTNPIHFSSDCVHAFVNVTGPPYSGRSRLSTLRIIPQAAAMIVDILTVPPLSRMTQICLDLLIKAITMLSLGQAVNCWILSSLPLPRQFLQVLVLHPTYDTLVQRLRQSVL